MLGRFSSGLVIYWCANNIITFTQQYIIMRSQGIHIDLLGNITSGFKRKPVVVATANPPAKTDEATEDGAEDDGTETAPGQEAPKDDKPADRRRAKRGGKAGGKSRRKRSGRSG